MQRKQTTKLPSASTTAPIEVEVRNFDYRHKGQLIGFADVILNKKILIRGCAYFIPEDRNKHPFVKWPSRSFQGPHGTEHEVLIQWTDIRTDFRLRGNIAKVVTEYLLARRSAADTQDSPKPTMVPKAEIPSSL